MAPSLKTLLTILLALMTILSLTTTNARPLQTNPDRPESNTLVTHPNLDTKTHPLQTNPGRTESSTLVTRLNLDANSSNCWESLFKLQACTGEVIQFFYNGETFLGPECCRAVEVIVHDCWPDLLNSLGFTAEEGDVLRGYCDAEVNQPTGPKVPSPPHALVPTYNMAEPIMEQV